MGIIVAAKQLSMDREVAVKLLRPEVLSDDTAMKRFQREVHLAKELAHPHIVQLFDTGLDGGIAWVAMELLQGENLFTVIQRAGPLPIGRALDILEQILDALTAAHRKSVVHRDLKPLNIFVTPSSRRTDFVKVLDFGIARPLTGNDHYVTKTGLVSGTLPYMAPEVLADNFLSPAADVYAAGLVFLEMLYGRPIFEADSPTKMALLHMRRQIPLPNALADNELGRVLLRATAKRREERYADADEFLSYLVDARAGLDESLVLSTAEIDAAFEAVDNDVVGEIMDSVPSIDEFVNSETMAASIGPQSVRLRTMAPQSAATADVEPESNRRVLGIVVIVAALLGIGAAAMLTGSQTPPAQPPAAVAATPPATNSDQPAVDIKPPPAETNAANDVEPTKPIRIESKPSGAAVFIDGDRRYETPVEVVVEQQQQWVLKYDGHTDKTVVVGPDTPYLMVELQAVPKPQPKPAPAKTTSNAPKKPKPKPKPKPAPQFVD